MVNISWVNDVKKAKKYQLSRKQDTLSFIWEQFIFISYIFLDQKFHLHTVIDSIK